MATSIYPTRPLAHHKELYKLNTIFRLMDFLIAKNNLRFSIKIILSDNYIHQQIYPSSIPAQNQRIF